MNDSNRHHKTDIRGSFREFGERIIDIAGRVISRSFDPQDKELAQVIWNSTFNLPGPKIVASPLSLNQQDRLVVDLFQSYVEIQHSLNALKDSAIFLRRYDRDPMLKKRGISRSRYVRYHNDKWISEAYILYERIESLLKRLSRRYRNEQHFSGELKEQLEILYTGFTPLLNMRGRHIHVSRHSDDTIQSMESIELLSKRINNKIWKKIAKGYFYEQAEAKCYRNMAINNKYITDYIDALFYVILNYLYRPSGELILPMKGEK